MEREPTQPLGLFYCYAREDHTLRDELDAHLATLHRTGLITAWYGGEIVPGTFWEEEIEAHLDSADIILLLISPAFIASDYCYGNEMKRALERHHTKEARVVPIILRPVDWGGTPFSRLQMLPSSARPVTSWPDRDEAFKDVAKGIRKVVNDLRFLSTMSNTKENKQPEQKDQRQNGIGVLPAAGRKDKDTKIVPNIRFKQDLHQEISLDHFPQTLRDLGFIGRVINGIEVIVPPLCDVPAGPFWMGNNRESHQVSVGGFQTAQFPVTVAEYACAVRAGAVREPPAEAAFTGLQRGKRADAVRWKTQPRTTQFPPKIQLKCLDHPVVCISWDDAPARAFPNPPKLFSEEPSLLVFGRV
ncbi:MAG TPA: TIR domain-containing protein, partial [Ktedonobacteraceae bacterium]|nr:TIR domain-containing protein [Ktedonobacteraceae bacterium]